MKDGEKFRSNREFREKNIMKQVRVLTVGILFLSFIIGSTTGMACTDFLLPFAPGNPVIISGRSMDFGESYFKTLIFKVPVGTQFVANAPGKDGVGKGYHWQNKYGFVGFGCVPQTVKAPMGPLDLRDLPVVDAMNTEGLSVASLWLDYTKFGTIPDTVPDSECVDAPNLVSCIVSNCANVDEAVTLLQSIRLWVQPKLKDFFLCHLSIHDQFGKSIVVEYVNGERKIYDNDAIAVLTNDPPYDWQATNFNFFYRNFTNEDNTQDKYVRFTKDHDGVYRRDRTDWQSEVLGSGMIGLPGDSTAPSRFVRAAVLRRTFPKQYDAHKGVQFALQLLGNIAVCEQGVMLAGNKGPNPTLWTVVRDHTHKIYYYSSRLNHNLKAMKFDELNFKKGSPVTYTIMPEDQWFTDTSNKLK